MFFFKKKNNFSNSSSLQSESIQKLTKIFHSTAPSVPSAPSARFSQALRAFPAAFLTHVMPADTCAAKDAIYFHNVAKSEPTTQVAKMAFAANAAQEAQEAQEARWRMTQRMAAALRAFPELILNGINQCDAVRLFQRVTRPGQLAPLVPVLHPVAQAIQDIIWPVGNLAQVKINIKSAEDLLAWRAALPGATSASFHGSLPVQALSGLTGPFGLQRLSLSYVNVDPCIDWSKFTLLELQLLQCKVNLRGTVLRQVTFPVLHSLTVDPVTNKIMAQLCQIDPTNWPALTHLDLRSIICKADLDLMTMPHSMPTVFDSLQSLVIKPSMAVGDDLALLARLPALRALTVVSQGYQGGYLPLLRLTHFTMQSASSGEMFSVYDLAEELQVINEFNGTRTPPRPALVVTLRDGAIHVDDKEQLEALVHFHKCQVVAWCKGR